MNFRICHSLTPFRKALHFRVCVRFVLVQLVTQRMGTVVVCGQGLVNRPGSELICLPLCMQAPRPIKKPGVFEEYRSLYEAIRFRLFVYLGHTVSPCSLQGTAEISQWSLHESWTAPGTMCSGLQITQITSCLCTLGLKASITSVPGGTRSRPIQALPPYLEPYG